MTEEITPDLFMLRLHPETIFLSGDEVNDFLYEVSGEILCPGEDLAEGAETFVGVFRLFYVDVEGTLEADIHPFDVFDAHSEETCDFYETIYNGTGDVFKGFKEEVAEEGDVIGLNLLIIDRVEILPRFRGKRIGLWVMKRLIDRFRHGAGLVAIKPFPLQFESGAEKAQGWRKKMRLGDLPRDEERSRKRLCGYYEQIGFEGVAETPYMVLPTAVQMPET